MHGPPKAIWNSKTSTSSSKPPQRHESDDDEEEESEAEVDEEEDEDEEEVSEGEEEESDADINLIDINDLPEEAIVRGGKGDFSRPTGSRPGLVFQHDNEEEKPKAGHGKTASDIDAVALRTYELSKLRYYFAIVVVNSPSTADHLYREVDGLELEHSSMALDLRIVPPEVSFEGRQVRDQCDRVSVDYVPPADFVMNAMQVQCRHFSLPTPHLILLPFSFSPASLSVSLSLSLSLCLSLYLSIYLSIYPAHRCEMHLGDRR
jgi:hypothetical protein